MNAPPRFLDVDDALLAGWPLPQPECDADKEDRGRVLIVAGSRDVPGAAGRCATSSGCCWRGSSSWSRCRCGPMSA